MPDKVYLCIDLKSFYASVECVERGLDPLRTNLVVADESRTEKTIVLAVSPALKTFGVPGRPRLFEVVQQVREINNGRRAKAPGRRLLGESCDLAELTADPALAVSYLVAKPRMAYYMQYSTRIYQIYLRFVAPEDIHVYSIDEVFMDITGYLHGQKTPHDFAREVIRAVIDETGITATAGIGTNLYLAKIAMDITAKKMPPDADGVRIAELDELSYRQKLWAHRPLTDFWRVGPGYAKKLAERGLHTMGDIARLSLSNEALLYNMFGVNAELLIDHAWGWEPCTIADIKAYKPETNSLSSGQVLQQPYPADKARLVMQEMADLLVYDLVEKGLVTDQIVLTVGYDVANLQDAKRARAYQGEVTLDRYGRKVPKHAHGTINLARQTSSGRLIVQAALQLYDRIVDRELLVRRLTIAACRVVAESAAKPPRETLQLDIFTDPAELERAERQEEEQLAAEKRRQQAIVGIKRRYGKNAVLKGINLTEGATAKERNAQIGGHKA